MLLYRLQVVELYYALVFLFPLAFRFSLIDIKIGSYVTLVQEIDVRVVMSYFNFKVQII
jgi:hypothetical protein